MLCREELNRSYLTNWVPGADDPQPDTGEAMTDRPIIFSALMIRALLDGRKSHDAAHPPQPPEWVMRMCYEGRNGWIGSGDGQGDTDAALSPRPICLGAGRFFLRLAVWKKITT